VQTWGSRTFVLSTDTAKVSTRVSVSQRPLPNKWRLFFLLTCLLGCCVCDRTQVVLHTTFAVVTSPVISLADEVKGMVVVSATTAVVFAMVSDIAIAKLLPDSRTIFVSVPSIGLTPQEVLFHQYWQGVAFLETSSKLVALHPAAPSTLDSTSLSNVVTGKVGYLPGAVVVVSPFAATFFVAASSMSTSFLQSGGSTLYAVVCCVFCSLLRPNHLCRSSSWVCAPALSLTPSSSPRTTGNPDWFGV